MAHPVTFKGSRLARWILKAFGWKLAFDGFPTLQGVAIVYPHTSNWDFPVGILAKWALGIPANFWGKDSLFKFPVMGAWMRWIGGVPIDRSSPKGVVAEMVQVFEQHKRDGRLLWLALAAWVVLVAVEVMDRAGGKPLGRQDTKAGAKPRPLGKVEVEHDLPSAAEVAAYLTQEPAAAADDVAAETSGQAKSSRVSRCSSIKGPSSGLAAHAAG